MDTLSILAEKNNFEKMADMYATFAESFIFSEIEHNLAIENIHSTKKIIKEINNRNRNELNGQNEKIIKNMLEAYEFIVKKDITEENIYNLYNIISKECLVDDEKLNDGEFYRNDDVFITDGIREVDKGVSPKNIQWMMEKLVNFINAKNENEIQEYLKSYIVHFYILYVHPYFDFNGRMARVLSYWTMIKSENPYGYFFLNEAINRGGNKKDYYKAIRKTRENKNNLTYFLEYITDIVLKYVIVNLNSSIVEERLLDLGYDLSKTQLEFVKAALKIPVLEKGYFDHKKINEYLYETKSKQFILRELNKLEKLKFLKSKISGKTKFYRVDYKKFDLYLYKK